MTSWLGRVTMLVLCLVSLCQQAAAATSDCGPRCLFVGLVALGEPLEDYPRFSEQFGDIGEQGCSLKDLAETAQRYGYHVGVFELQVNEIQRLIKPAICIAHISGDHFVIVKSVEQERVTVLDPPDKRVVDAQAFSTIFDGHVLVVSKNPIEFEAAPYSTFSIIIASGLLVLLMGIVGVGLKLRK